GVERHVPRPHVDAGARAPAVLEPRVVPELAGQRHRVEIPEFLAGPDVERPGVAGHAERDLASGGAEDRDVLIDRRDAVPRDADVDRAVAAEPAAQLTGGGVER